MGLFWLICAVLFTIALGFTLLKAINGSGGDDGSGGSGNNGGHHPDGYY